MNNKNVFLIGFTIFLLGIIASPARAMQIFPGVVEQTANPGETILITYTFTNDEPETYVITTSALPWSYPDGNPVPPESWITFKQDEIVIGAWEQKQITVEARALENIEGELRAMLYFEQRPAQEASGSFGTITRRIGKALYLGIRGTMIAGLDITNVSLKNIVNDNGVPYVSGQFFFENSGNVHVRPYVKVTVLNHADGVVFEDRLLEGPVVYPGVEKMIPLSSHDARIEDGVYRMIVKSTYMGLDIDEEEFEMIVENGEISLESLEDRAAEGLPRE